MGLEVLDTYAALLTASDGDPIVRSEVGPELIAPAVRLGGAVLFQRLTQMGTVAANCHGPIDDVAALLASDWRAVPGWSGVRALTVDRAAEDALTAVGCRIMGRWEAWQLLPAWLVALPDDPPDPVEPVTDTDARAFVAEHHTSRWIPPAHPSHHWLGVRTAEGALRAVGLGQLTPAGETRLTSITVRPSDRGAGLGRAVSHALIAAGLQRSPAVILGVESDNPVAKSLYASLGFRLMRELSTGAVPAHQPQA